MTEVCPIAGCTAKDTHHHLDECDGRATPCEGGTDEHGQQPICCHLGDLYAPKEW